MKRQGLAFRMLAAAARSSWRAAGAVPILLTFTSGTPLHAVRGPAATLYVPWFELAVANPSGPTTLFAVRNEANPANLLISYYEERGGAPLLVRTTYLAKNAVRTVNVRDDLAGQGRPGQLLRGWVKIQGFRAAGSRGAVKMTGDFFHVDPSRHAASGDVLVSFLTEQGCNHTVRFVNGGGDDGSTEVMAMVLAGSPQVVAHVYADDGSRVSSNVLQLPPGVTPPAQLYIRADQLAPGTPSGTLVLDGAGPMYVRRGSGAGDDVGHHGNCAASGNVVLPFFEIARNDPEGKNTLVSVINHSDRDSGLSLYLYDEFGQRFLLATPPHPGFLRPHAVWTLDLRRDLVSSTVPRGWAAFVDPSSGFHSPALSGDFTLVEPRTGLTSAGELFNKVADCSQWSTRFLNGGPFSGGTRLLVRAPNAAMNVEVFDETGRKVKTFSYAHLYRVVDSFDMKVALGATPMFGSLRITFPGGRGHLFVEHRAEGQYAVGLPANCLNPR
jgi:hypothetical protein